MKFVLSDRNVYNYLREQGLGNSSEPSLSHLSHLSHVERVFAKNFNLLVTLATGQKLLVKQEQYNSQGETAGELFGEWRIKKFLQTFPELDHWNRCLPELLVYDEEKSILVSTYLDNYRDLSDFYSKENHFPMEIATQIGSFLATVHRDTWNQESYLPLLLELKCCLEQLLGLRAIG